MDSQGAFACASTTVSVKLMRELSVDGIAILLGNAGRRDVSQLQCELCVQPCYV